MIEPCELTEKRNKDVAEAAVKVAQMAPFRVHFVPTQVKAIFNCVGNYTNMRGSQQLWLVSRDFCPLLNDSPAFNQIITREKSEARVLAGNLGTVFGNPIITDLPMYRTAERLEYDSIFIGYNYEALLVDYAVAVNFLR